MLDHDLEWIRANSKELGEWIRGWFLGGPSLKKRRDATMLFCKVSKPLSSFAHKRDNHINCELALMLIPSKNSIAWWVETQ